MTAGFRAEGVFARGRAGLPLALVFLSACSTPTVNLTARAAAEAGAADGGLEDASVGDGAALTTDEGGLVLCGAVPCACSNNIDDDLDGLIDGFDPECSAPFDNDEATFGVGLHGDNDKAKCRDCFFDGNSGAGDDGCDVAASCSITGEAAGGACRSCAASERCQNTCLPRVPNGCDCFGCCEVRNASGVTSILLQSSCSTTARDNPALCQRCILVADCFNPCDECELCAGKTPADLPSSCGEPGQFTCESGAACSDSGACAAGGYCVQGCCIPPVL